MSWSLILLIGLSAALWYWSYREDKKHQQLISRYIAELKEMVRQNEQTP